MPYPMARPDDPVHLKNFDPKTFYPQLAPRNDSLSIYPSSSVSQVVRPPRPSLTPSDSWLQAQRRRTQIRIWLISICFVIVLAIIVALFAWLGSHNWFKDNNNANKGQ